MQYVPYFAMKFRKSTFGQINYMNSITQFKFFFLLYSFIRFIMNFLLLCQLIELKRKVEKIVPISNCSNILRNRQQSFEWVNVIFFSPRIYRWCSQSCVIHSNLNYLLLNYLIEHLNVFHVKWPLKSIIPFCSLSLLSVANVRNGVYWYQFFLRIIFLKIGQWKKKNSTT